LNQLRPVLIGSKFSVNLGNRNRFAQNFKATATGKRTGPRFGPVRFAVFSGSTDWTSKHYSWQTNHSEIIPYGRQIISKSFPLANKSLSNHYSWQINHSEIIISRQTNHFQIIPPGKQIIGKSFPLANIRVWWDQFQKTWLLFGSIYMADVQL
jgi:hypothetical protein